MACANEHSPRGGGSCPTPGSPGVDLSRGDAVADDEVFRVIDGDLPGDINGSGLAHTVRRLSRRADNPVLRAEIDDAAPDFVAGLLGDHLLTARLQP